jgi:lipoprotein-anchoring transpeptidase ErfK/SrfK
MRGRVLGLPLLALLVAVTAVALLSSHESRSQPDPRQPKAPKHISSLGTIPPPVSPAFVPGKPRFLNASRYTTRWAVVRRAVAARAAPATSAPVVAKLAERTPEGTTNIVVVLGARTNERGRLWVRVRVPTIRPPGTGWVPRDALGGYGTVTTHLVVDLRLLRATLFRRGRPIFRADVGVGRPSWPTPRGEFYIRNKLTGFASPMYGPIAFGTSARSAVLTDWPAGGYVGIHGTDRPDLLPGRVSHGCIRMRNADVLKLARLMPVGTPVTVR